MLLILLGQQLHNFDNTEQKTRFASYIVFPDIHSEYWINIPHKISFLKHSHISHEWLPKLLVSPQNSQECNVLKVDAVSPPNLDWRHAPKQLANRNTWSQEYETLDIIAIYYVKATHHCKSGTASFFWKLRKTWESESSAFKVNTFSTYRCLVLTRNSVESSRKSPSDYIGLFTARCTADTFSAKITF